MKTSYIFLLLCVYHLGKAQSPAKLFDNSLLLTEVFPDPTPSAGLPEKEFVEIYNPTSTAINLQGWQIKDTDKAYLLGPGTLLPKEYLILCKTTDTSLFRSYGKVYGLPAFISLNNTGDTITLVAPDNIAVHQMSYGSTSFTGGFSLELAAYTGRCAATSWVTSQNKLGGTPGSVNSMGNVESATPVTVLAIVPKADTILTLTLNQRVVPHYESSELALYIDDVKVRSDVMHSAESNTIYINHHFDFLSGKLYQIQLEGLKACNGSVLPMVSHPFLAGQSTDTSHLIINELLFNPFTGGADFVELYNHSTNFCDLKGYEIGSLKSSGMEKSTITEQTYLVPPQGYVVLTTHTAGISTFYKDYNSDNTIEMELPAFNNDSGTVSLYSRNQSLLDQFNYHENMHFVFLENKDGVSLERISPDSPSLLTHNWHSAASAAGGATPGKANSQHLAMRATSGWKIDPVIFSPDGDGYKDFTALNYSLEMPGHMATVTVYDVLGNEVKTLAQNTSLGTEGFLQWDGTTNANSRAPIGNYLLHVQVYHTEGQVQEFNKEVTLSLKY